MKSKKKSKKDSDLFQVFFYTMFKIKNTQDILAEEMFKNMRFDYNDLNSEEEEEDDDKNFYKNFYNKGKNNKKN